MTTAAGRRPLLCGPVTPNAAIVKRPLGHNLVEVSVLWIPRIAVLAVMAHVALVKLWDASVANAVMASGACRPFLGWMRIVRIRAYE